MTKEQGKAEVIDLQALLTKDADFIRTAKRSVVQAALEAEMTKALGAEKGERTESRRARWIEWVNVGFRWRDWRQVPVRGLTRVTTLVRWQALTHNMMRIMRTPVLLTAFPKRLSLAWGPGGAARGHSWARLPGNAPHVSDYAGRYWPAAEARSPPRIVRADPHRTQKMAPPGARE